MTDGNNAKSMRPQRPKPESHCIENRHGQPDIPPTKAEVLIREAREILDGVIEEMEATR